MICRPFTSYENTFTFTLGYHLIHHVSTNHPIIRATRVPDPRKKPLLGKAGIASIRRHRILALALAATVGTLAFASSPVFATTEAGDGSAAGGRTAVHSATVQRATVQSATVQRATVQDVAAGEAYTKFIVDYKESAANATPNGRANAWGKAAKEQGVAVKEVRTLATGGTLIEADRALSGQAAEDFMTEIAASGSVESVEPDARMTVALTPNDPRYGEQWDFTAVNGMRIPGAWDVATGTGVTVAVIDTGITAHADFDANVLPGYDFVADATAARDGNGRDANAQDQGDWYAAGECGQATAGNSSWHGTHVAGTVAAVTGNATGVAASLPTPKWCRSVSWPSAAVPCPTLPMRSSGRPAEPLRASPLTPTPPRSST